MNKKKLKYRSLATALLCGATLLPSVTAEAQQAGRATVMGTGADACYMRAADMLRMGNYAGVVDQLGEALSLPSPLWKGPVEGDGLAMRCKAMTMMMRAAYERGDEAMFNSLYATFLDEYGGTYYALDAKLMHADFLFFKADYAAAVTAYSALDIDSLDPAQSALCRYRLALSMVRTGYFNEAARLFSRLKANRDHSDASRFYLAYIDYVNGDLRAARKGFNSVPAAMARQLGADYYLAQIDFQEGDFNAVAGRSQALLASARSAHPEWVPELNRIIGESHYNLGDGGTAESYLREYVGAVSTPQLTALYALGVIDYDKADYEDAAECFSRVTGEDDAMAQSAYLYLGQIAAGSGDYNAAALSFHNACELDKDRRVSETALYNYAVATVKGGSVPFKSSAEVLDGFVRKYPDSKYASKVDEYLATVRFNEKDYVGALRHIERLRNPSRQALESKQKILFQLGVQSMRQGSYAEAAGYMERAADMASQADRNLAAQARLWQGDALYSQGKYSAASGIYTRFVKDTGKNDDNRALGLYNLGYSLYQEKKFAQASRRFAEALAARPALPGRLASDARLRMADCDYYDGNVSAAMDKYASLASDAAGGETDYATFQHANMLGATGDNAGKARELVAMLAKYPESRWRGDARLELVNALCATGDMERAAAESSALLRESPDTPQARKAALAVAAAWQEDGNDARALAAYKELVKRWPTSAEAADAVEGLKNLYAAAGDMQGFLTFLDTVPSAPRPDAAEMEEISYDAALRKMKANPSDLSPLNEYLRKYPDGANAARAMLALADAQHSAGDDKGALATIDHLLTSRPDSESVPAALMLKGGLLEDAGNEAAAAAVWRELLDKGGSLYTPVAYAGLMRASAAPADVVAYADRILAFGDIDTELMAEAMLAKGTALRSMRRGAEAIAALKPLADGPQTSAGAQASVVTGEILLSQGDAKGAERQMLKFIDSDTEEMYWLARGYIVLADAYHAQGESYKAKEYLRALKNNYSGTEGRDELMQMISSRLSSWK